jgi:hypothetical protein
VSLWLNSGVPATEVAHRVAVLLKIYAHCIDGVCAENLIRPGGRGCLVSAKAA